MCATSSRRWAVTIRSWTSGPNGQPSASQARQTAASSPGSSTRSRSRSLPGASTPAAGEALMVPRLIDHENIFRK
jgi:hypothetical protein